MKSLLVSLYLLLLLSPALFAQKTFEGIIRYKIELTGDNAREMAAYMPQSYEYQFKGNGIRFQMNGGLTAGIMGDILIDTKKGEAYMLKEDSQTAYRISSTSTFTAPTITATNETLNILGYRCKKYKVSTPTEQGNVVQYVWATPDIELTPAIKKGYKTPTNAEQLLIEGLDGFPLKIMTTVPEGGFIMVMTAAEIDLQRMDKADFMIPKGYDRKDFDASMFGGY